MDIVVFINRSLFKINRYITRRLICQLELCNPVTFNVTGLQFANLPIWPYEYLIVLTYGTHT